MSTTTNNGFCIVEVLRLVGTPPHSLVVDLDVIDCNDLTRTPPLRGHG